MTLPGSRSGILVEYFSGNSSVQVPSICQLEYLSISWVLVKESVDVLRPPGCMFMFTPKQDLPNVAFFLPVLWVLGEPDNVVKKGLRTWVDGRAAFHVPR